MPPLPSRRFLADLDDILERVAASSPTAADKMLFEIERQAARLEQFPFLGRPGRLAGTRELVVARTPYLIIYSSNGLIVLLRLLHGAQNWPPSRSDPLN